MNGNYKSLITKKKAFTLIELLIVIAIIGILFIVLVSKVDFATDKSKASGVQTDFRSFQMAFETVSKENAGFNSFGWNTGDTDGNRVRNAYDEGDKACTESGCTECKQDGVMGPHEVWTGHKVYTETWDDTCFYTLVKPGTTFDADGYDKDAIFELETAINKNLDPKLHITIDAKTGLITMANGAQDPWNTQYHGAYISAEDGMDRGAIVMYSNGANQKFGSEHDIANGVPTIIVPGNNKDGADDYSLVVCYTYTNGYGEIGNLTTGFSNNQNFFTGNSGNVNNAVTPDVNGGTLQLPAENPSGDLDDYTWSEIQTLAKANLSADELRDTYGIEVGDYKEVNGVKYVLVDLGDAYGGFVFMYNSGTSLRINSTNTNTGGYASSEIAPQVEALYTNLTDSELKAAIKEVTITCNDGKANYKATHTYTAHMFLASYKEVGFTNSLTGTYAAGYNAEGICFDLFTADNTSRTKFMSTANISSTWWLRSAFSVFGTNFYNVITTGSGGNLGVDGVRIVVPAFVIG